MVDRLNDEPSRTSVLLKAMSNEHRLVILSQLVGRERSVGELTQIVGLSQSALSQHLARLRRDGLVRTRREAQTIFYTLASREAEQLLAFLSELFGRRRVLESATARGGAPAAMS